MQSPIITPVTVLNEAGEIQPNSRMSFPDRSKYYINRYRFELPATRGRNETPDLDSLSREELVDMIKGLHNKLDKYEHEMQSELKEKLKQARLLGVIEMHMDCPPATSEGHHQILSLDHATTWLGKYGPEDGQGLILGVNSMQRATMSRRLLELMNVTQLCDTRPACKHVLQVRPKAVTPGTLLSFKQIALGYPIREVLKTFTNGVSEQELWDITDGRLRHFTRRDPEISRDEYREMSFLTAYFHTQLSSEFQSARLSLASSLQREGHERKAKKECEYMPQSNIRRVVNVVRMAMDPDSNAGKVSPTNSTPDGLAVVPRDRRKSRLPRPTHQRHSRLELAAAGPSAAMPMMSGAMQNSGALRTAGTDLRRNRQRPRRPRHHNEERPGPSAPTRHRVPRAPREPVVDESPVSPVSPHPTGHRNRVSPAGSLQTSPPRARPPRPEPSSSRRTQKPPSAAQSSSRGASTVTQWPGPSSDSGKSKAVDKGKGKAVDKGKGKEVVPPTTTPPGPSSYRPHRRHVPARPSSSVYSVNPLKTGVPPPAPSSIYSASPLRTGAPAPTTPQRLRSSRQRTPNTNPRAAALNHTPSTTSRVAAHHSPSGLSPTPRHHTQDSPPLSIPEGVDLGAMAGGLRHNRPHRRDSRASTIREDLGTKAGGPYIPPRTNWREDRNPQPFNLNDVRAEHGNVPHSLIPTASPLPRPPLIDRRQLRTHMEDSVLESDLSIPAPTSEWSSRIDLPPSPDARRGRSRTPRSAENINYAAYRQRGATGSRFREHIDSDLSDRYNPTTNPDPSRSRGRNRDSDFGSHMQRL